MSFSINGLVSNLDTGKIIQDLMKLERLPYTRLETKKEYLTSEQTVFRTINTKLTTLQNAIADLKLPSTFKISSATSSDESAVKVTAKENASAGQYKVEVTEIAQSHTIKSAAVSENGLTLKDKVFTFDIPGSNTSISINTSALNGENGNLPNDVTDKDILEYVKNEINKSNAGVSASVMSVNDAGDMVLVLSSKETGAATQFVGGGATGKEIQISGSGFQQIGFVHNGSVVAEQTQEAKDAEIIVNGVKITKSKNTIDDVIAGVTLQLQKKGLTSNITVASDGDKVADKVEAFVKAYNDVVESVRGNLAMPSDKTKMNPLQSDALLKEVSNSLYSLFNGMAGSTDGFKVMSQLGLTIDKGVVKASLMTGKITFDKELFKSKLNDNANAVTDVFRNSDNETGIMNQLDKQLKRWTSSVDGMMATKMKGYDAEIEMVDERMIAMGLRLEMKEKQLKSQFTTMEVALTSLKNQQSWLTNQLAALAPKKD